MAEVITGDRLLEKAELMFTPAACAILVERSGNVIESEHPLRGKTPRGFINVGVTIRAPRLEHTDSFLTALGLEWECTEH